MSSSGEGTAPEPVPAARGPWWRDRRRRDRVTVWGFAVLGIGGILLGASLTFARGDQRVVVVTLQRDPSQTEQQLADERQRLKQECGALPGITVVADQGNTSVQGRFPVRFGIRGADNVTRASLDACLARHADVVRGVRTEGE